MGDVVIAYNHAVIGKITEAGKTTARVELFSSPEKETAFTLAKTGDPVVAKGQGGGSFILRVPQDTVVAVDDALTLQSTPEKVVAFVTSVSVDQTEAYKTVHAVIPVNVYTLRHVGVEHTP